MAQAHASGKFAIPRKQTHACFELLLISSKLQLLPNLLQLMFLLQLIKKLQLQLATGGWELIFHLPTNALQPKARINLQPPTNQPCFWGFVSYYVFEKSGFPKTIPFVLPKIKVLLPKWPYGTWDHITVSSKKRSGHCIWPSKLTLLWGTPTFQVTLWLSHFSVNHE